MIEASACVEAETAARYVEHSLLPGERLALEHHIDGCADCRALVSALVKTAWSQDASTQEPPPGSGSGSGSGELGALGGVLPPGTRVGPFEIERPLDAGGMGVVYAAHDRRLDRRVALKCVRELRGASEQLRREARMMAQLAHPNVVPVYDVLEAQGQVFLAMELVVGRTVRQWLEAEPRSWRAVVDVFLAAGAGLAAAHAAGIIHSDVKPANILLGDDGRIRIADFGLSYLGADEALEPRGPRGTPAYMAPAQRAGQPCDAAGDQYAFCASLHEAVFGAPPGLAPTSQPRIPRGLRRILARGLAAEPGARFGSMALVLRALRQVRSSRTRWLYGTAAVAIVLVALAYGVGRRRVQDALCEAAAPRLTSPWDAEARAGVRRSFRDAKLPYGAATLGQVEANLDGWTRSFEAARHDACERGWLEAAPPPARFSAQLGCLADRAREARALVSQLRGVDATIAANAVAATEQLTPLSACEAPTPRAVAPDSPARDQLADQFALTKALDESGKFRDALPLARANVQAADALGDPALRATALVKLGAAQIGLSDYASASTTLLAAIGLAEAAQDDRARAKAWVELMQSEYNRGHHDQVVFMRTPVLGVTERIGDVWLQTEALLFLGGALCELGRAAEAMPLFEDAVRLRRQMYGEHDRRLAFALSSLGNGYAMQGNLAAGLVAHRQAVETAEAALGPAHPNVGVLRGNLGSDYLYGLQPELAISEIEKSLAVFEAANGPKQRKVAGALTDLGFAQLEAGQRERAAETFARAEALWQSVNAKHPIRAQALLGQYLASEALGRPTNIADLETALTLSAQLPPFDRGRIQLALGRASTGPRAAELVHAAVEGLGSSTLPLIQRELAAAHAWQRAHGAAP